MGAHARSTATVLELRPPEFAKVRLDGMLDATIETRVERIDDGRTRLRHRIDYRFKGGPIGQFASRALQMLGAPSVVKRGVVAQKRQAEALRRAS